MDAAVDVPAQNTVKSADLAGGRRWILMELDVTGSIIEWRGPAPYWFLPINEDDSAMIDELKPMLTYGWGCIPVTCTLGRTAFTTSIMPRDGIYLIPLKVAVRKAESVSPDAPISLHVTMTLR